MEFVELIAAKDAAIAEENHCAKDEAQAEAELAATKEAHAHSSAVLVDANKAIHDVLAEYGEHYLVDQKDGTVTIYKVSDEPPGYRAVHPIPGTTKAAK